MQTQQLTKPSQTQTLDTANQSQGFQSRPWGDKIHASSGGDTVASRSQTATDNQVSLQRKLDASKSLGHSFGQLQIQPTRSSKIQTKLTVGSPGDKYEQEADRVAEQVVARLDAPSQQAAKQGQTVQRQDEKNFIQTKPLADTIQREGQEEDEQVQTKPLADTIQRQEGEDDEQVQTKPLADTIQRQDGEDEEQVQTKPLADTIQRQDGEDEEQVQTKPLTDTIHREGQDDEEQVQTKPSDTIQRHGSAPVGPAAPDIESTIKDKRGSGSPLEPSLQRQMSEAFGRDLSGVRVHTDSQSDMLNRSLHARAFTTEKDVFFKQGEYNPGTTEGKKLIAHELTHVVQQSGGQLQRKETKTIQRSPIPAAISSVSEGVVQREEDETAPIASNAEQLSSMLTGKTEETEQNSQKNQAEYTDAKAATEETESKAEADLAPMANLDKDAKQADQEISKTDEIGKELKPAEKPTDADKQKMEDTDKKVAEAEAQLGLPVQKLAPLPADAKTTEPSGEPPKAQTKLQTKVQTKADSAKQSVTPKSITDGPVVQRGFWGKVWSGVKSVGGKIAEVTGAKTLWNLAKAGFQKFAGWVMKAFPFLMKRIMKVVHAIKAKLSGLILGAVGAKEPIKNMMAGMQQNKAEIPGAIAAEGSVVRQVAQIKPLLSSLRDAGSGASGQAGAGAGESMQINRSVSDTAKGAWDKTYSAGESAYNWDGWDSKGGKFASGAVEAVAAPLHPNGKFWKDWGKQYGDLMKNDAESKVLYGEGAVGIAMKLLQGIKVTCQKLAVISGVVSLLTGLIGLVFPPALAVAVFATKATFVLSVAAVVIGLITIQANLNRLNQFPPGSKERALLKAKMWKDAGEVLADGFTAVASLGGLSGGSMARSLGKGGVREAGKLASKAGGRWGDIGKSAAKWTADKIASKPGTWRGIVKFAANQAGKQGAKAATTTVPKALLTTGTDYMSQDNTKDYQAAKKQEEATV